jgi:hypothetical protein
VGAVEASGIRHRDKARRGGVEVRFRERRRTSDTDLAVPVHATLGELPVLINMAGALFSARGRLPLHNNANASWLLIMKILGVSKLDKKNTRLVCLFMCCLVWFIYGRSSSVIV